MELEEHEIQKYIGVGEVVRVDRGTGEIQVRPKGCKCVIIGASPGGPFEVDLCPEHSHLERLVPAVRYGGRWRDELMGALGILRENVAVTIGIVDGSQAQATIRMNLPNGGRKEVVYPDVSSTSPEVAVRNIEIDFGVRNP